MVPLPSWFREMVLSRALFVARDPVPSDALLLLVVKTAIDLTAGTRQIEYRETRLLPPDAIGQPVAISILVSSRISAGDLADKLGRHFACRCAIGGIAAPRPGLIDLELVFRPDVQRYCRGRRRRPIYTPDPRDSDIDEVMARSV